MWTKLQLVAAFFFSVQAASLIQPEWGYYFEQDDQGPGTYSYGYDIEDPVTRNIQFRRERRLPNGTVTGSYGLVEPDGNIKIVQYTADHLGYRATIENTLRPNEVHPHPDGRVYTPPRPSWDPYSYWTRGHPTWDPLWYRDNKLPSPVLGHALESLQTLGSPVEEQRTPPASLGYRGESFLEALPTGQDTSSGEDVPQENRLQESQDYRGYRDEDDDNFLEESASDQSQNYPSFEIPPENQSR